MYLRHLFHFVIFFKHFIIVKHLFSHFFINLKKSNEWITRQDDKEPMAVDTEQDIQVQM